MILTEDPRVVNLEGHNLADLNTTLVPDTLELAVMDLSCLAVAEAVGQLGNVDIAQDADLVALVKPTFELRRGTLAASDADIARASARASAGISDWRVVRTCAAPATGQRGARKASSTRAGRKTGDHEPQRRRARKR